MLHLFTDSLHPQLIEDLGIVRTKEPNLLRRMTASVSKIQSELQKLKEYIIEHPFSEVSEEIYFFKHIKPKFYSKLINYTELYQIDNGKPYGTMETITVYFGDEINIIRHFFRQNQSMYEYYKQGMTELDNLYFV